MAIETRAGDWQVCLLLSLAGGAGVAAGTYRLDFYSASAGISARFKFFGVGIGEGGNLSGTLLPAEIGSFGPWSGITCDQNFSVWDLNGSWGRLSSVTIGLGVTLGPVLISAAKRFWSLDSWFHSQDVGGFGTGVVDTGGSGIGQPGKIAGLSASGEVVIGRWGFIGTTHNVPGPSGGDGTMA